MAQKNNLTAQPDQPVSLATPIWIGAGIGLILISLFLFGVDHPRPEWGKLWMVRPLIMVPLSGAMGGLFFYFMNYLGSRGDINKTLAVLLGLAVCLIGLWLGMVLGLNGTLWN